MHDGNKDFRDRFYRHVETELPEGFVDERNSLGHIYLSLVPFVGLEYLSERTGWAPPSLVFPIGFLLFWAFYYTYYKPSFLEELSATGTGGLFALPLVLLGVSIW